MDVLFHKRLQFSDFVAAAVTRLRYHSDAVLSLFLLCFATSNHNQRPFAFVFDSSFYFYILWVFFFGFCPIR